MSDPMFENSKVIQVLETPQLIETPKKVKKPRKPMSEERKEALREQLKKARETKKAKKEAKTPALSPVAEEEIKLEVGGHSIPKIKIKRQPKKAKVVEQRDDSFELKRQLDELRTSNQSQEREILKQQIANQQLKQAHMAKPKDIEETVAEPIDERPPSPIAPTKRYSTYKKSVWAEYGV